MALYDKDFSKQIRDFLALPEDERDVMLGAQMLFRLNHNKFLFFQISRNPAKYKAKLFYELNKFLKYRLAHETQNDIEIKTAEVKETVQPIIEAKFKGKREDHDLLPDEIKACYVENATLLSQMRVFHTKLRIKSNDKKYLPCDRYDDLTCLLELRDKYLENWKKYDNAQVVNPDVESSVGLTTSDDDNLDSNSKENDNIVPTTAKTKKSRQSRGKKGVE